MRLGGPVFGDCSDPARWIGALKACGYRAAYCPLDKNADDAAVKVFTEAARAADIVIAEVGAWSNPMAPDPQVAKDALAHCQGQLALAERVGARCCVNISGSCGTPWDGPDAKNLTRDTFDKVVEVTRAIIDAVKPTRTYYTLETMPWMYPDSVDSYLALLEAIDRPGFAVHLDPVNLVCSPQRYFGNGALLRECFAKLGPHIRSCHGKDITLASKLMTHLDEIRPGLGALDYKVFLSELHKLEADVPLMLEHLQTAEEYIQAAEYVRKTAAEIGVAL